MKQYQKLIKLALGADTIYEMNYFLSKQTEWGFSTEKWGFSTDRTKVFTKEFFT